MLQMPQLQIIFVRRKKNLGIVEMKSNEPLEPDLGVKIFQQAVESLLE
jgi:hypothetical protein